MSYSYTGVYRLDRSHEVSREQADEIARHLSAALATFGFTEDGRRDNPAGIYFSRQQQVGSLSNRELHGSDATISVAFRLENHPRITIRDFSDTTETEFMRALKNAIEQVLAEKGLSGVRFERQPDLF